MTQDNFSDDSGSVLWQGRPAPRCYVFMRWKQALVGGMLFLLSSFWFLLGWELVKDDYPSWILLLPLPLVLGSFAFGPWQLLRARMRWPQIFYSLTVQRITSSDGLGMPLVDIRRVRLRRHGEQLASVRLEDDRGAALILSCIEQPDQLLALLREHCPQSVFDPAPPPE